MIRSIAFALGLGALVAALAAYAVTRPQWRNTVESWLGRSDRAADTTIASEAWPICTTMDSLASDSDAAELDPDFAAGKKALGAGDWDGAIAALKLAALRDPQNADIQNYIGYAYRRLRQLEPAFAHYRQALALNSRHRSAHEHLGEAHLVKGELAKAQEHLAALEDICLIPCVEYDDLRTAIATYNNSVRR
jgi:tetratricopeptide (TPR) repeat protein